MIKRIRRLIGTTFRIWDEANTSRMSAAMTYFTMLSLAPLLVIAIAIAGFVFGTAEAQAEIVEQVRLFTTDSIADTIASLISNTARPESGIVASTISILVLGYAASGVFSQLQDTFDDIWDVADRGGITNTIKQRLIGIAMVLVAGVLLLAALVLNASLNSIGEFFREDYPFVVSWLGLVDRCISYLLLPIILSAAYWLIPNTRIRWTDVLPAALATAVLIGASHYLIELYLRFSTTSEVYGAAGSLVVLLIWVYMTGLVVFFGAALSRAWSENFGSRYDPKELSKLDSHTTDQAEDGTDLAETTDKPPALIIVDQNAEPKNRVAQLQNPTCDWTEDHVRGTQAPDTELISTDKSVVQLSKPDGITVVHGFPAIDDTKNLVSSKAMATEAVLRSLRSHESFFASANVTVFGLSNMSNAKQIELAVQMDLPFELLSDLSLSLNDAMKLPTVKQESSREIQSFTLLLIEGRIAKVLFPIQNPERHVDEVVNWLRERQP